MNFVVFPFVALGIKNKTKRNKKVKKEQSDQAQIVDEKF